MTFRGFACAFFGAFALVFIVPVFAQERAGRPDRGSTTAWVFKPATPGIYTPPNRPHWKLPEVLAKHAGSGNWAEPVIKDEHFFVQYISLGLAGKTPTSLQVDTIIWFIVKRGQLRFNIKGQTPFVASKDFIVQIPMRTPYSMETVGDEPSVRLEVRIADGATAYPVDENPNPPQAPAGYVAVKALIGRGPEAYADGVKPYLDFQKEYVHAEKPRPGGGPFYVTNARGFVAVNRSQGVPPAEPTNLGHFHLGLNEFWMVMEGEVDFQLEGIPDLIRAYDGDVVYAPRGSFHRASNGGSGMSTRIPMGGVIDSGAAITLIDKK